MPQMFNIGQKVVAKTGGPILVVQGYLSCDEDCVKVMPEGRPEPVDHMDQYDLKPYVRPVGRQADCRKGEHLHITGKLACPLCGEDL